MENYKGAPKYAAENLEPLTPETDNLFLEYIRKGYKLVTYDPIGDTDIGMGFVDPATYDSDARFPDFIPGTPFLGGGCHTIMDYFSYITKRASKKNEVTQP